jgi:hypothetical protein
LDYKVITSEKKLLKQELSDEKGIGDILNDKIGKILYEKEWLSASQSIQCTQQEVIAYHQKRYTEDNMRIVDNDRNNIILKRPSLQVLIFPKFKDKTYYFTAK